MQGCKQEFGRWGAWGVRFQIELVAGPRIELVAGPPPHYFTAQSRLIFFSFTFGVTCFFPNFLNFRVVGGVGVLRIGLVAGRPIELVAGPAWTPPHRTLKWMLA